MGIENWIIIAIGGLCSLAASILYMLGGTSGFSKALRRFIASFILALSANIIAVVFHNWNWQLLLIFPCLAGGFSLGYGAYTIKEKIFKRTVFALGVLSACFCGLWSIGFTMFGWVVVGLAFIVGLTSVVLGVFNPFVNAPLEQYLICQLLTMFIPFWGLVK